MLETSKNIFCSAHTVNPFFLIVKKANLSFMLSEVTLFLSFFNLSGLLVDITKDYKYMYFVCGIIVVVSSIWLFIGNAINYRLLAKEKKLEDERQNALKNADSKEVEPLTHKESEEVLNRSSKMQDSPSEKETNI